MPDTKGFDTFFEDYVTPKSTGEASLVVPLQETLDNLASRKADSACAGITHAINVRILNKTDDLHYGTPTNANSVTNPHNDGKFDY